MFRVVNVNPGNTTPGTKKSQTLTTERDMMLTGNGPSPCTKKTLFIKLAGVLIFAQAGK